jgi:hypothetical protein
MGKGPPEWDAGGQGLVWCWDQPAWVNERRRGWLRPGSQFACGATTSRASSHPHQCQDVFKRVKHLGLLRQLHHGRPEAVQPAAYRTPQLSRRSSPLTPACTLRTIASVPATTENRNPHSHRLWPAGSFLGDFRTPAGARNSSRCRRLRPASPLPESGHHRGLRWHKITATSQTDGGDRIKSACACLVLELLRNV